MCTFISHTCCVTCGVPEQHPRLSKQLDGYKGVVLQLGRECCCIPVADINSCRMQQLRLMQDLAGNLFSGTQTTMNTDPRK